MTTETVMFDFPEDIIHFPLKKYEEPELFWKLVQDLLPLCDMLTDKGTKIANSFNQTVSCKMGCGECCCQMVPLSPPEAAIIYDVIEKLDPKRKEAVCASIETALEKLDTAGIRDKIYEIYRAGSDRKTVLEYNRIYFELKISCPFLVDGSCSIYPFRASRCREYSVLTPSEWCSDPFDTKIRRLPLTIRLCESFSHAWASLTKKPPVIVPLVKVREWVEENPEILELRVSEPRKAAQAILESACARANERAKERMKNG